MKERLIPVYYLTSLLLAMKLKHCQGIQSYNLAGAVTPQTAVQV